MGCTLLGHMSHVVCPMLQENTALRQQVEGVVVQMLFVQADASLAQQSVAGLQGQLRAAQQERAGLQTQATAARRELLLLQVCGPCKNTRYSGLTQWSVLLCPLLPPGVSARQLCGWPCAQRKSSLANCIPS